jgi:hypothetical protein
MPFYNTDQKNFPITKGIIHCTPISILLTFVTECVTLSNTQMIYIALALYSNAFQTGGHGRKKINISFYGKGPPIIYFYIEIRLRGATEQKSLKTYAI